MSQIVNNDKLVLILTNYGLNRIAEANADASVNLNLTKIKFGSGDNYEYYTPSETQTSLKGDLGLEFYIYKKALLEDGLTISFYTIVPEKVGGVDIREVGLYEEVDGEDHLFAIGVQQPFVKPSTADNYFINIDYYIFLKAANFAEVYDQIYLDPMHALVQEADFEEMLRTFLFSNANLMQQIGNNSTIIGYDRPSQLYELIAEDRRAFSYITLYKNYANLIKMCGSENVFSYWAFDYSRRLATTNSIVDISKNANFLSTNLPVSSLPRNYEGFMSTFKFDPEFVFNPDRPEEKTETYFFLSSEIPIPLFDPTTNTDIPFTVAFAVKPLDASVNRTLLAKSNYNSGNHMFEFSELGNGSVQIKLFSSAGNYLTFVSDSHIIPSQAHSLVLSYDAEKKEFIGFVNERKIQFIKTETGTYTHMKDAPNILYAFTHESDVIYANREGNPTLLFTAPYVPYTGTDWNITNGKVYYDETEATYDSSQNITTGSPNLTSYITKEINGVTVKAEPINSEVGLISIITTSVPEEKLRAFSLLLCAALGSNPLMN